MRVVVQMTHSNPAWDDWFIDFPDVADHLPPMLRPQTEEGLRALARERAEAMSDSNGGGWTFAGFHGAFPHEA